MGSFPVPLGSLLFAVSSNLISRVFQALCLLLLDAPCIPTAGFRDLEADVSDPQGSTR